MVNIKLIGQKLENQQNWEAANKIIQPNQKTNNRAAMVTYEYFSLDDIDEVYDDVVEQCKITIVLAKRRSFSNND